MAIHWSPEKDKDNQLKFKIEAFAAKTVKVNGVEMSLYKRIRGKKYTAAANAETNLDFICPFPMAKVEAIEIINGGLGDNVRFEVLHAPSDTFLNEFGDEVYLDASGKYVQASQYDADITDQVKFRLKFTNAGAEKDVYINFVLNEVK